ncbi:MAG: DUF3592 domain-containing protein [Deltaproteobacteria bacterium]|nr:DUF3592 domain-containing protein [Deltaproteobacteria bacterium]
MFVYVFGAIFILCGAAPIWLAQRAFAKDRAIARWPRAPGKITVSTTTSHNSYGDDAHGVRRHYTLYTPVVEYTYTVAGSELRGTRLTRVTASSTSKPDMGRYPVGQDVMVFHDPSDPSSAYLEVHRSIGAIILTGLGALFVFIGVLVPTLVLSCGAA